MTSGDRADAVVVWATLDRTLGRGAIKSFVVERDNPGMKLERLEHKLGIRASDTANFVLDDCRVPKANLLGSPEVETASRASPASCRPSTTPARSSPAMAIGVRPRVPRPDPRAARRGRRSRSTTTAAPLPGGRRREVHRDGVRLGGRAAAHAPGRLDGRQPQAELAGGLDGQGQGRPDRHRHRPRCVELCGADRLQRGRAAREVGARRQDPRHLRGHSADPAARRRASAARQDLRRAQSSSH